jgi:DNA-binding beta-propeller fold protein YncE
MNRAKLVNRLLLATAVAVLGLASTEIAAQSNGAPQYIVEPFWPKPLPDNLILGQVAGVAVDNDDSVWIIHRPSTLVDDEKGAQKSPPETRCCLAAPPVLHFSSDGKLLASWGGTGTGYDWPSSEHGIHIDKAGNVWLAGNGKDDHQILKFTPDGKFLQQIGKAGATGGSNSKTELGRPAHMVTDEAAGELYVADGYLNRRIIVFDAKTGDYKRHWGAYGTKQPTDEKLPAYTPVPISALSKSFSNPVHCVRLSGDGLVYMCDRANNRIQVFQKDGTFVKEFQVDPQTLQNGSVWDLVLSEDSAQRYIFVADGANMQISTLDRQSGEKLAQFGRPGRMAGEFKWVHNMAIDSKGNLYTSEVGTGRRVQKFKRSGGPTN